MKINLIEGKFPTAIYTIALAFLAILILINLKKHKFKKLTLTAIISTIAALIILQIINYFYNPLKIELPLTLNIILATLIAAIILEISSIQKSAPRWKVIAIAVIPIFITATALQANLLLGHKKNLASLLDIPITEFIKLPDKTAYQENTTEPLWSQKINTQNISSKTGRIEIPTKDNTFHPRPAGIYLPPTALIDNPPQLPLIIMMMGQPGEPDINPIATVLEEYQKKHSGLAPIVIVADQIGPEQVDTACSNSKIYGNIEDYIVQEVPQWALDNLNIQKDPKMWTIAGYSNGGTCAAIYGAKYPEKFLNILSISGEEYPGMDAPQKVLENIFSGDQEQYDKQKIINILSSRKLPNTLAIFTVGSNDNVFLPHVKKVYEAALASQIQATYHKIPGATHFYDALIGGLNKGTEILYPRLELSKNTPQ